MILSVYGHGYYGYLMVVPNSYVILFRKHVAKFSVLNLLDI